MSTYTDKFYRRFTDGWLRSARALLPHVFALHAPRSVLDVGCGIGAWGGTCLDLGAKELLSLDGDYVPRDRLVVDPACFHPTELAEPLRLGRRFDLAICLEVAEHLEAARAASFVGELCAHAPVVLFSGAIPFQGGTGHVNEQWPEYWVRLFAERGFRCLDVLRPAIWDDDDIFWWYRQNALLFVDPEDSAVGAPLAQLAREAPGHAAALVHPEKYLGVADPQRMRFSKLWRLLPGLAWRSLARKLRRS